MVLDYPELDELQEVHVEEAEVQAVAGNWLEVGFDVGEGGWGEEGRGVVVTLMADWRMHSGDL